MEGICFELLSIVNSLEASCGPSKKVLISGGITHSPDWVQLLSTITGKELILSGDYDASALGAAAIAFKALNIPYNFNRSNRTVFIPDRSLSGIYQQQFELFEKLYLKLESQFGQMESGKGG